ncbi:CobW family GTP-binding protein [Cohnella luojiensis]|uniref:GTP-binding protein n=1 Tax=Cohnella luojiensis TaxID=652876 RepID=A0A4Y8LW95_9BACL|nr:GTP-binding protein [Cohnella luojiensis]TFE24853.1 GTP-binding protein [Cohnella luojiensis]
MNDSIIPVYVLTGFLGSGKTTILNRILDHAKTKGIKPAILLNEVGDVNIEGQLIEADIPMSELLGGCICCTSRGDLGLELVELAREHKPEVIWIESTGVAQPLEIMDGITEASLYAKLELKNVVTVVDSRHLLDRMRIGSGKTFKLMKEQIRAANILVLNKVDLVQTEDLTELQEALASWNSAAKVIVTTRGELDPAVLYAETQPLHAHMHRHAQESAPIHVHDEHCNHDHKDDHVHHHHDHHQHSIVSEFHDHVNVVTYYFQSAIDSVAFENFLKQLPESIYRAKGIVTFRDTASLFLFQYAYKEVDFLRITPQKSVNNVAVFIGEGFSQSELLERLEKLES